MMMLSLTNKQCAVSIFRNAAHFTESRSNCHQVCDTSHSPYNLPLSFIPPYDFSALDNTPWVDLEMLVAPSVRSGTRLRYRSVLNSVRDGLRNTTSIWWLTNGWIEKMCPFDYLPSRSRKLRVVLCAYTTELFRPVYVWGQILCAMDVLLQDASRCTNNPYFVAFARFYMASSHFPYRFRLMLLLLAVYLLCWTLEARSY